MKKTLSKQEAIEEINGFFKEINDKTPKEIKKIKRLAMAYNVPLKEKRKLFCGKCYSVYQNPKVRIKKGVRSVECEKCGRIGRWKL